MACPCACSSHQIHAISMINRFVNNCLIRLQVQLLDIVGAFSELADFYLILLLE